MTLSGKTNAAKCLAREYQKKGIAVAVLDPLSDPEWGADYMTRSSGDFLECARQSRQLALFIDESGESVGRYNDEMFWLATRARHYGHKSHFITQRPSQLSRTVWTQCVDLFCFGISEYDAKLLANEWNRPEIRQAASLAKYECYHARKMGGIKRMKFGPAPPPIDRGKNVPDTRHESCSIGSSPAGEGETETTESGVQQ